jgi:hypothetical protein
MKKYMLLDVIFKYLYFVYNDSSLAIRQLSIGIEHELFSGLSN